MLHAAQHGAALFLHDLGRVGFQGLAEGVVGGQEVPALVATADHGRAGALGERDGVVGVVHGVGRALFIGEHRRGRAVVEVHALLLGRDLGQRQAHARVGAAEDHAQALRVDPLARLRGGDVGLVLVVDGEQLDRLAGRLAAEVVDGHLDRQRAVLAFEVGVQARHVGDEADLDLVLALRLGGRCERQCGESQGESGELIFHGCLQQ
ncbi:hypothetical protein D9M68_739460 [compost metagenome]